MNNISNINTKTTNIVYKTTSATPTHATNNNNIIRSDGTQACAACKYQRRKCAPDCILAPYFPHDRQRQFLNAHKLFGVSNIIKIIRFLDQRDKDEAMRTIIYQSDIRANDPVGGCYRIIRELQRQIEYNQTELQLVLHQLAFCRAQDQQQNQNLNGLLDMITNNVEFHKDDDHVRRQRDEESILQDHEVDQVRRLRDEDQKQQYVLQNGINDENVHFEDINSWEVATDNSVDTMKPF